MRKTNAELRVYPTNKIFWLNNTLAQGNPARLTKDHTLNTQPTGHHSDGSSIQKHSCGAIYPYVLVIRDSDFGRLYGIITPGDSTAEVWRFSAEEAYSDAEEAIQVHADRGALRSRTVHFTEIDPPKKPRI